MSLEHRVLPLKQIVKSRAKRAAVKIASFFCCRHAGAGRTACGALLSRQSFSMLFWGLPILTWSC